MRISHGRGILHLKKNDPILKVAIEGIKLRELSRRGEHFEALVVAIVNQQLSGKAADTIFKRFVALFPRSPHAKFPTPKRVLKMPARKMRKAGLSKMKASFIKDLAKKVLDGTVDFKKMPKWTDDEVIEHLTRVKGIGRWTAEMFLMFSLGREDVFSYGDLGLRNAMRKLYKLRKHPTPKQAEKISAKWKPYRSLASRYLWASLDGA
jgi:DNA-3-methyladenine glycosylase II